MSDLPSSNLLQQMSAKQVSGEHLEVLGKTAAAKWLEGHTRSLNDAVVETVKQAGLSPEQVKRVIEFANTDAYLQSFRKEGAASKVVDFGSSGPASPAVVLQDLNDGGGGSVFDPGTGDYNHPPREKTAMEKAASADGAVEEAFWNQFGAVDPALPEAHPFSSTIELRDKLASVYEQATSQLTMLENMFDDLRTRTFDNVKQAALSGTALSEVSEIWQRVAPSEEHVKVAFTCIFDRLLENGVFATGEAMAESFQKVAHVGMVNEEHPLITDFKDFCETLSKLAEVREEQQVAGEGLLIVNENLKLASEGILPRAAKALSNAAGIAGKGGEHVGAALMGKGKGQSLGTVAKGAVYAAPVIAGHELYRRTLKHNPGFQAAKGGLLGAIPGTAEYNQKEYELQMNAQGMGGMY